MKILATAKVNIALNGKQCILHTLMMADCGQEEPTRGSRTYYRMDMKTMKTKRIQQPGWKRIPLIPVLAVLISISAVSAPDAFAGSKSPNRPAVGYQDRDGDGKNDLFQDADGNGVNDVNGQGYSHQFAFQDADGDGVNDRFLDADGDGINDISQMSSFEKTHGIIAIDVDGDGINDITGMNYGHLMSGKGFIDEDGDGFNDWTPGGMQSGIKGLGGTKDSFIDEDGDGINDGRGFSRERRENEMKGSGSSGGSPSGGDDNSGNSSGGSVNGKGP